MMIRQRGGKEGIKNSEREGKVKVVDGVVGRYFSWPKKINRCRTNLLSNLNCVYTRSRSS